MCCVRISDGVAEAALQLGSLNGHRVQFTQTERLFGSRVQIGERPVTSFVGPGDTSASDAVSSSRKRTRNGSSVSRRYRRSLFRPLKSLDENDSASGLREV